MATSEIFVVEPTILQLSVSWQTKPSVKITVSSLREDNCQNGMFKVKTTMPGRYIVQPNIGLIQKGSENSINISVINSDYEEFCADGILPTKDKFLVQTAPLDDKRFNQLLSCDNHHLQLELNKLWKDVPKESIGSVKIPVKYSISNVPKSCRSFSDGKSPFLGTAAEEYHQLNKKYNDLILYSKNLSDAVQSTRQQLETVKKQLKIETMERITLESKLISNGCKNAPLGHCRSQSCQSLFAKPKVALLMAVCALIGGYKSHQKESKDQFIEPSSMKMEDEAMDKTKLSNFSTAKMKIDEIAAELIEIDSVEEYLGVEEEESLTPEDSKPITDDERSEEKFSEL